MKINSSVAANSYLLDAVTNNIDHGTSVRSFSLRSVRSIIMRLMLVVMIVGGWNVVRGQSVTGTINFGSASGSTNINAANITGSDNLGNTWTITTVGTSSYTPNSAYSHIGSNNDPASSITFTTTLPRSENITSMSAKFGGFSGTAGTVTLKVGNTSVGSGSLNATSDVTINSTSTSTGNVLTVTVSGISKGVKVYYISYTYSAIPYNVTWSVNGNADLPISTSSLTDSNVPADPATPSGCTGKVFVGWTTSPIDNVIPDPLYSRNELIGSAVTSDVTYYAVFAEPSGLSNNYMLFSGVLEEGDYIIYYDGKAMNTTVTSNRLQYVEETPISNTITTTNAAIIWHIATSGSYWTIYNASQSKYVASTGTKNQAQMLADGSDNKSLWAITGTSVYEFVNKHNLSNNINAYLRNNGTSGFACYASSTGGDLYLYKRMPSYSAYSTSCVAPTTATITYNANGGSGNMAQQTVDIGDYVTISANGFTAPTEKHFLEWNTAANGSGTSYSPGDDIPLLSSMTLYAIWEINTYNVVWYVNGASIRTRTYDYGSSIPEGDVPDDPTSGDCNGKTFIGWSATEFPETDDDPTLVTAAGATVNGEMNFYAVFAEASGSGHNEYCLYSGALTEGDYVIYYSGKAMNTTVSSDRLQYEEVTPISNTITTTDASIVWHIAPSGNYWTIYNAAAGKYAASTGVKNKAQMLDDGTDDKSLWSNSGTSTYEFVNKKNSASGINSNLRNNGTFGFACYASGTGGALSLYKRTISYSAYSTSCTPCEADATISSTALTASDITISSATINCPGGITNFGGAHCHISSYGFVYGTSANPTLENGTEVVAGTTYTTTNTSFNKVIEDLDPCTTYHVRAYATNGHGTVYGPNFTFTTANNAAITSLTIDCMKNTGATISIEYTSCTTTSEIFAIAIRKGSNPPVSLGTTNPSDIAGNTEFGSGYMFGNPDLYSYVVYKGNSMPSSVTVTGLEAGHTYKLKAYRWIAEENKWTTNGTTMTLALPRITNLQRDNDETSETLTWNINGTVCDGGRYVVICKEGNSDVTSTCTDFTSITANTVFSTGTQTQTGEYVVHSGSETSVSITGLTAGTQYMAAVFYVDDEGNCSPKAQTTFTYSTTTILEPGDLAIVAINNTIMGPGNKADEFSFVIFKKITTETSIDMTDNGYGRLYDGLWGTSEGFWRITRKNSSLDAGSVITITETTGSIGYTGDGGVEPDLWHNINIYVNGVRDYGNWEITVDGPLDLNEKDQIWIMQGGEWLRDTEGGKTEHNAYYTGNVLYGYTATGWLVDYGYEGDPIPNTIREYFGTRGSVIYPGRDCFTSSLNISSGIAKFIGPFTPATKREWIIRINDEANWVGYDNTSDYISSDTNYKDNPDGPVDGISYPLPIMSGEFTKGKWSGKKSSDWCDCANWMSLVVPDENIDVEIPNVGNYNEIEIRSGDVAKCKTLTITALGRFRNTQENSTLQVMGDITIDANGTFRPSEGKSFEIKLGGNIVSNGVFITNENTSLTLFGEESHSISAPSNSDNLKLNNLTIGQALNNFASDTIELYGNLYDNSSSGNGFELPQSLSIRGTSSQTSTSTAITDITMNKSSNNLTLSGMLTVNGQAKFVKGNIVGDVTFTETAISENASTDSYVDGTVTKKANASAFSFPTGSNGVLGTLEVSSLDADTDLKFNHEPDGFDASEMPVWWNQNNMCGPNEGNAKFDHVTNMYFWNLGTSATIADAVFSVSADDDVHFNSETIEHDNADIDMAIYDGCWKNLGGTAATSDPYHLISVSDVDLPATRAGGDKVVTFGSIDHNTLLPIELTAFSAECNGSYAKILWTTATERNNDYFVLERSDDAISFDEIARLAGAGSSINPIDYTYIDNNVHGGDIFYRLVQVDYDGTRSVSEIIAVNCAIDADGEPEMAVYPNPFANDLTLRFENFGDRVALVEVYDMLGRMLVSRKVVCSQNDYEFVLPLGGLPDGAYNVRVSAEDFVIIRQVVKNR